MNLAHPSFGGLTIGQCTCWSNCKEIKQGNPFSYLKLFKTKNISPVKKRAKTNFTQRYCRVTEIMLGLGFFLLSWVVSARVVPWRIPWHHSPAALSLCRTNWKIYSLRLASDVLKWDCPAPLSANNEFYENRLISSFALRSCLILSIQHSHQCTSRKWDLFWNYAGVKPPKSYLMCTHTCVQVMHNNGSSEVRFFPRASNPGASDLLGRVRSPRICRLQGETFCQRRNRFSMLFRRNHHWIQLIGKACLKPWLVSNTTIVLSICCQNQKHPRGLAFICD